MATETTAVPMTLAATVERLETQHKLWGTRIDALEAAGGMGSARIRLEHRRRIDDLKARLALTRWKMDELRAAGGERWRDLRVGAESAGGELDAALRRASRESRTGAVNMWLVALILVLVWGIALLTSHTLGGAIHILLLPALVMVGARIVALRLVRRRRTAGR